MSDDQKSSVENWVLPSVGDVVILAKGFEQQGQESGPHYGLVLGRFKVKNDVQHRKFLLIAPGSSRKTYSRIDLDNQILVEDDELVGRETIFFFEPKYLIVYPFPSDFFCKSNVVQPQPGQVSAVKGVLKEIRKRTERIRQHYDGDMMKLYQLLFSRNNISMGSFVDISSSKPKEFLD